MQVLVFLQDLRGSLLLLGQELASLASLGASVGACGLGGTPTGGGGAAPLLSASPPTLGDDGAASLGGLDPSLAKDGLPELLSLLVSRLGSHLDDLLMSDVVLDGVSHGGDAFSGLRGHE